jgi:hyperosmotically inducible protein
MMLGVALGIGSFATYANDTAATSHKASAETAPSEQPGTDAWITTKVKTELMTTKGVPSTDISVTTNNGVVMLSGVLDNKAQVQKSVAVAKAVKGVRNVDASALSSRN